MTVITLRNDDSLRPGDTEKYREIRRKMIQKQIFSRGITDAKVLAALEEVPRHRFVTENMETAAYDDSPVPIEEGQTISQPFIVAYMTEALGLSGAESILEVGTGSGYQASVLAEIVQHVYTIEINENLAIEAARRFKKLGYSNISLRVGDGWDGWPEKAPFDGIVVTAAPEQVPPALIDQLKPGARMIIPVGEEEQELYLITKLQNGGVRREPRIPVRFVPMLGERTERDPLE